MLLLILTVSRLLTEVVRRVRIRILLFITKVQLDILFRTDYGWIEEVEV